MKRNIYLEDIPLHEAQARLTEALKKYNKDQPVSSELINLRYAVGRITAEAHWAKRSSPHYHAAAMDGYAVQAQDTLYATETQPVTLQNAYPVNTGDPLPDNTNAVIMIENLQLTEEGIVITDPVAPWQHVRMMGEDMIATELVLPAGHKLRPVDLGALAGCGYHQVSVYRKPRVIIIPTGSELVPANIEPKPGQITEYNSLVLAAQVEESGGEATILPITPDDPEKLRQVLFDALDQTPDLILILSGSSAGSRDYTAGIIQENGELLVHGVAVRPGHPVIIGMSRTIPVIGVPGYPVSAALTGEIIIQPLITQWLGMNAGIHTRLTAKATMTRKLLSPIGDDDFVRVTLAKVGEHLLAAPLNRGAGVITSLVRADALAHIPRFSEGVNAGDEVDVILYRPLQEITQSVFIMGSHDPMLDLLGQFINQQGFRLTSANVGSLGGIVAIRRREAHLAGMHLLDEETGEYNLPYLKKQLNHIPLKVVTFSHREQGFIVARGNPKNITNINDLTRVRYVNRQRGAGTRLLLDYELKRHGIDPLSIQGYEQEEYTHLAVAAAIATGIADCGLGVRSAAIALNLDFVPVGWERYDLVIPEEHITHPGIQILLDILNSETFKAALSMQPGYDTHQTGQIIEVV